ncbi:hypothetical protein CBS147326_7603 [Penicillium roqueforti]|nr:hypothetical protein CBS147326_7603 [Penicillium roqueforti]
MRTILDNRPDWTLWGAAPLSYENINGVPALISLADIATFLDDKQACSVKTPIRYAPILIRYHHHTTSSPAAIHLLIRYESVFHIEYSDETIESDGSDDTSDTATKTSTDSKSTATATATIAVIPSSTSAAAASATATVAVIPSSTSAAAAAATSTAADDTNTSSTDADTNDDDEDDDEDDEDDEGEDDEEEASTDATKEKKHRHGHGHGHHKLRARAVLSSTLKTSACNAANAGKFSTVIKNMNLDAWVEYC